MGVPVVSIVTPEALRLRPAVVETDTLGMSDLPFDSPHENAEWIRVLAAYRAEQTVRKQTDPEHDGWIDRLTRISGLETEQLSSIHGRLIAFGLLKFQLTSRTTGVQYQISPAGVKSLEQAKNLAHSATPAQDGETKADHDGLHAA